MQQHLIVSVAYIILLDLRDKKKETELWTSYRYSAQLCTVQSDGCQFPLGMCAKL